MIAKSYKFICSFICFGTFLKRIFRKFYSCKVHRVCSVMVYLLQVKVSFGFANDIFLEFMGFLLN